jgi:WD40 repeat protein
MPIPAISEELVFPGVTCLAVDGPAIWTGSVRGLVKQDANGNERKHQPVAPPRISVLKANANEIFVAGGSPGEAAWMGVQSRSSATMTLTRWRASDDFADTIEGADWSETNHAWAVACLDGQAAIIDPSGESTRVKFTGHSAGVTAVAWIDDQLVASSSRDHTIRVWSSLDGRLVRTLNNHTDEVIDLARRPSKDTLPWLASAGRDGTIRLWQPTIGRLVRFVRLEGSKTSVARGPMEPTCLCWTANGTALWVGTSHGDLLRIDPNTAKIEDRLRIADDWITSLAIDLSGKLIVGIR